MCQACGVGLLRTKPRRPYHVHGLLPMCMLLALSQGPPRRSFFISILFGSSREVRRSTSIKTRHVGWLVLRRVKTAKVAICSGSFALQ